MMAAVQDFVRWLKARHSLRRKRKDKDQTGSKTAPSSPQLGSRVGVALPPIPPPGWPTNMPDISRDCMKSPYHLYDEIPAYAIDTRLDILKQAHGSSTTKGPRQSQGHGPYLVVPLEDRELYRLNKANYYRQQQQQWINNQEDCARRTHLPRQSTPWHHSRDAESLSSGSFGPADQLDRWVSIPESLNYLGLSSHESLRRQPLACNRDNSEQAWYAADTPSNYQSQQEFTEALRRQARELHSAMPQSSRMRHRSFQEQTSHPDKLDQSFSAKERVDTWSDDSGMSSPSLAIREHRGTPWIRKTRRKAPPQPPPGKYSDTDSNTSFADANAASCHSQFNQHRGLPKSCHRHDVDSSDTYNEYDRSDMDSSRSHNEGAMSPQEYSYYLSRTRSNLQRTHGIKNFVKGQSPKFDDSSSIDPDSTQDSFDLTSVTSLSDFSLYMDEEVARLTSMSGPKPDLPKNTSQSAPSEVQTGSAGNHSAFKPYPSSKRRHSYSVGPDGEQHSTLTRMKAGSADIPQDSSSSSSITNTALTNTKSSMDLEERLSCRVTNLKISDIRRRSTSQVLPSKASKRPSSALVPNSGLTLPSQNKVLSDIMRMNHDRQILALI